MELVNNNSHHHHQQSMYPLNHLSNHMTSHHYVSSHNNNINSYLNVQQPQQQNNNYQPLQQQLLSRSTNSNVHFYTTPYYQPSQKHHSIYTPPSTPPFNSLNHYQQHSPPLSSSSSSASSPCLSSSSSSFFNNNTNINQSPVYNNNNNNNNCNNDKFIIPKIEVQRNISPLPYLNLDNTSGNNTPQTPSLSSSPSISPSPSSPQSPVLSSSTKSNKIYDLISNLIPICNELNNEDLGQKKVIINKIQESIEDVLKEIKKIKKTRLPFPKPIKENEKKFISLRPRRNRKCTNKTKTLHSSVLGGEDIYCLACGIGSSPEWRKGPDGCKSLCNACGLYYAKSKKKETEIINQPDLIPKHMKITNIIND